MFDVKKIPLALTLAAISSATLLGTAHAGGQENKRAVDDFLELIHAGKVDEAFDKYVGTRYVQHDPRLPDGVEGAKKWLKEQQAKADPSKRPTWEAVKVISEGNDVVQHAHVHNIGGPDVSVMSWFRFDDKGKIVEHWAIAQPVPAVSANNNGMFGK